MSALQLLVKKADRNLLDVLTKLPQLGVGSRVTRKSWEPYGDSYWEITAVKPATADGKAGEAWGVLTWRGKREDKPRLINGRTKRLWRWLPSQQEAARLAPLAQQFRQQQLWQQRATQGSSGSSSSAPS